jgi:amino acid adenylation domain-containing protein
VISSRKEQMKILLTMNLPYTRVHGGTNRSNKCLAEGIAERGHSVRVVVPALAMPSQITLADLLAGLVAEGIEVIANGEAYIFEMNGVEVHAVIEPTRLRAYLTEQLRSFEPDWAFVSAEDQSQNLLDAALKVCPMRVVYLAHTPQMFPFGPASLYPGKTRTELVGQAAAIVTQSHFVGNYIKQWTGFEVFVNQTPHYGTGPFPDFGCFDEGYVLLMNACAVKGISIFLALAKQCPEIQFAALAGYGTTEADRKALAAVPNITLLPNLPNLDDILCQTRLLLMPTLWMEGFGMAVVDVMLRGIPVLASNFGGLTEAKLGTDYLLPVRPIEQFEEQAEDNLLPAPIVPEQDIAPWHTALTELLSNRRLYESQSNAAREAALKFVNSLSVDPLLEMLSGLKSKSAAHIVKKIVNPDESRSNLPSSSALDDLTPEQRAIMQLWLKEEISGVNAPKDELLTIKKAAREKPIPLSFAQRRLWFLEQLGALEAVYNLPLNLHLSGHLDVAAVKQTLDEIVRRHEILRTTFKLLDGEPTQVIAPEGNIDLSIVDFSALSLDQRAAQTSRLTHDEARRPFDLSQGPLLRVTLIQLSDEEHVVLLTMHHIISDGWSMRVLMKELVTLYEAFSAGRVSPLPELPVQYADYAIWQCSESWATVLEDQLSYWKQRLAGSSILELPLDYTRPRVQTFNGANLSIELAKDLSDALKTLSQREDVTLFMTMLTCFKMLLARYTGQQDIVVGSPVAGRNFLELENLIGFFVNMLALRTNVSGDPSFRELLLRVKETAVGAFEHQDVPFERIVEEMQVERNLDRTPIFQVVFVLQNAEREQIELPSLRLSLPEPTNRKVAKFELTWGIAETSSGLVLNIEYNTDLFQSTTMDRMTSHFVRLLESIVADPDRRLSALPILTTNERQRLLVDWNDTTITFPKDQCVHELFETEAEHSPDALAIVCGDEHLTYAELNLKANQLAHHLRSLGIGPESLVGVLLERSVSMVVALLGVLKSGGAYLPLDPAYPRARLSFMLSDSEVTVLLTQEELAHRLGETSARVICLDRDWETISREEAGNPDVEVTPENLAYVIYTSGSTGQPKGVQVPHRGLLNLVHWHHKFYQVTKVDRATQLAGVGFDASAWELWPYLAAGARLYIIDDETRSTPERLQQWLIENAITVSFLPTPLAESVLNLEWPKETMLRAILTGGDKLHVSAPEFAPFELFNNYGPTENTVVATAGSVSFRTPTSRLPNIGRPIANVEVYLLDDQMQPVPVGVGGELYIGGESLARGYFKRPELTAERFLPHPFTAQPGARLYRTGDLARYLDDGQIDFLGRLDQQVKVRGYRIELGEIEALLSMHELVREAVVAVSTDGGDKRLVAYVAPAGEQGELVGELRRYLRERVPDYMIPTKFIVLETLPLTPNGKIDKRALLTLQSVLSTDDVRHANGTPVEEILTGIWGEVLNLSDVRTDDNFFEVGGHSLLATQLISRVRETFQIELPLRSIFEEPTVTGLAAIVEREMKLNPGIQSPPILPVPRDNPLPLSFAQQRFWFLDQLEPNSAIYNIPIGVRLTGPLDIDALRRAFNELVRRHEILRTNIAVVAGQPVQIISSSLTLELPLFDLRELPENLRETEAQCIIERETRRHFDFTSDPLLRVNLVRLAEDEHIVLMTTHHIVLDGWSMSVLIKEITALYEMFAAGRESSLPELSIQYADFAVWQQNWLRGEALEPQLAYWQQQLAGAAMLELPTDKPRPRLKTFAGTVETFTLSSELTNDLRVLSRRNGVTIYMTLVAAFKILLQRYSGMDDIVIGSGSANRNRFATESLLGCFFNWLTLRTDLSGNPTFRGLLQRVRTVTLGAYAHQDLPFEKLLEKLQPERDTSYSPLFQVALTLQNFPRQSVELGGLKLTPVASSSRVAKSDMHLAIEDSPDRIHGIWEYNTDLFEAATITRMIGQLQTLLKNIVENPDQEIEKIELSTENENRELIYAFDDDLAFY